MEHADRMGAGARCATMGPRRGDDTITPHTRPPADDDCDHVLVRTGRCLEGNVEVELVCEPVLDYGRTPAEWSLVDEGVNAADASGAGQSIRLQTDMALGVEGERERARHTLEPGEQVYCSLSWADGLASPQDVDEAKARLAARLASARPGWSSPHDHRWRELIERSALTIRASTYMPTGATIAALTTSLPETPGGERNWDYRYTWMRDSTFTLQALHLLNLDWEPDEFMQFVADLEPNDDGGLQIMYGIDGRRDLTESTRDDLSVPARGLCASATARSSNARTTSSERCWTPILLHTRRSAPAGRGAVADRAIAGGLRKRGVAPARPGHLGGARRAPALRVLEADVLGRVDRAAKLGRIAGDAEPQAVVASHGRRDQGGHPRASGCETVCCASSTTPTSSTPPRCWRRFSGSCARTTSACANPSTRSPRRRPKRLRCKNRDRRDRRRPVGQGGHLPDLLVLARIGHWRSSASWSAPAT